MSKQRPVVIVTGGSAGIGQTLCEQLIEGGYYVLNLSRRAAENPSEFRRDVTVDLADVAATKKSVAALAAEFDITSVVHNAGVIRPDLIEDVNVDDLQYLTNLHVTASVILMQETLPAMKAAKFGRFVIIGTRAMLGLETRSAYAATKAAQIGLVRTWALELGKHGVTVNAIAPGPIVTDMFRTLVPEDSGKAEKIAASLPVRRLGRPEDVASAVRFFLAPENGFVTGQCLFVCGGASIGSLSL